jgi:hypothetical protein
MVTRAIERHFIMMAKPICQEGKMAINNICTKLEGPQTMKQTLKN